MINGKLPKIWHGGDYNPEQWNSKEIWDEDVRMFKLAGIDVATLNVFSWALNQPNEEMYNFEWLDDKINRLYENGIYTCLATSTAAHPAWMAKQYPDILRVDFYGRKRKFGSRHNSCPNSPTYREYSEKIADKLAERYKEHPAVLIWHVSNEYGGYCYCDNCQHAFQNWLMDKYGTLEKLNKAWNTGFWGHTFYEWDEIVAPNILSEERENNESDFQGISLDYRRFQSDSLLDCYKLEYNAIRKHIPDTPITTNLMGTYPMLDYFKWAKEMDVVSWDNYPAIDTPFSYTAMTHDLMRGLKGGQPFMLMEQTPSQQNWQPYNSLKRPGVMRLWSYQAIGRGADTILYFQLHRSVGACEKYHGAVIEHVGHENTRVFNEVTQLGKELNGLSDTLLDARVNAKVAIIFDWENRWATELSSGPSVSLDYVNEVHKYYDALYKLNVQVDMIGVEEDLSKYDIVIAPILYMVKEGYTAQIEKFVENGGTFLTTFFSGIVNETDIVTLGGYPGELRKVLGIWAEEIDALHPDETNEIVMKASRGHMSGSYSCNLLFDLIHTEGAQAVAEYGSDFYKGMPVLTVNQFGQGKAWYVASSPDQDFLMDFLRTVCEEAGVEPLLAVPEGVETTERMKGERTYLFVLNHNNEEVTIELEDSCYHELLSNEQVSGNTVLKGKDVLILAKV